MAKKIKKFGATTLAAVLASSALVPAALAADPVQQQQVDEVVIVKDGKNITVTLDKYEAALRAEIFTGSEVKYVVSGEKIYKLTDYETALRSSDNNTPEEAIALLSKNDDKYAQKNLQTVEGEIKNGELVAKDETPEEKVNETFFYNLAA
ncbi:hypothetical protein BN1050_01061 [Metalysinibacillus saudimassiliensis]|uniref:Uncharacterized protein n=1 Tax=Metalysinibacillus saudimassiliensis TaxID=1461583 RepID=A0A078M6J8_9BACL|nr:hypothetical protein BN1050_01061 [Metalysinibacillus saudimassiliensis]